MIDEPRYHVFLSHHEQDVRAASLIAEWLQAEHSITPWLRSWSAIPGRLSQEEQERGLAQSQACAVLIGAAGVRQWQQLEVYSAIQRNLEAEARNFPVIPVYLPECPLEAREAVPDFLKLYEAVCLTALDDEPGLQRLVGCMRGESGLSATITLQDEPAPYRGLLPFEAEHARFFFGRDDDIHRLVDKLAQNPFVAVVGASGSGKSSLVKAGLLPRLKTMALPDTAGGHVLSMTPGGQPLRALANQLSILAPSTADRLQVVDALTARLQAQPDGLRTSVDEYMADDPAPVFLFIDQFEELFTQCPEGPEQGRAQAVKFVANLVDAFHKGNGQIRVLITLRTDFYDQCLAFSDLRGLLEDGKFSLDPLGESALLEIITRPAREVGAFFEKGLVTTILRDVGDVGKEPGRLPLLEHTLHELWVARFGPWLVFDAYEDSGGVQNALQKRADETYHNLAPEQQAIARNIFLRLTALGEGVPSTRRRVRRDELYPVNFDRSQVDHVLQILSGDKVRLISLHEDGVEISHEALIQGWPKLQNWLQLDRDALGVHHRLTDASREWLQSQKEGSYLWSGARLEVTLEQLRRSPELMSVCEQDFIQASKDLEVKARQTRRRTNRLLSILFLSAIVLAIAALLLQQLARHNAEDAEQSRRRAESQQDAQTALVELEKGNPEGALLLTLAASSPNLSDEPLIVNEAVRQALDQAPVEFVLRGHTNAISSISWSPDGTRVLSAGGDGNSIVWDTSTGEIQVVLPGSDIVLEANWSPDGRRIVSAEVDGLIKIWDGVSGARLGTLQGHTAAVRVAAWSPDGQRVLSGGYDGTARIWDARSYKPLHVLRGHSKNWVGTVAWSPDGQLVLTGSEDSTAKIWDATTGELLMTLPDGGGTVASVSWSSDGQRILTGDAAGEAKIWDTNSGELLTTLIGHTDSIWSAQWSPNDRAVVTSSSDGTARIWDPNSGSTLHILDGHNSQVPAVAWSPDGRMVLTGSFDNMARIWNADTGEQIKELKGHTGKIWSVSWSPSGQYVATAGDDFEARIWAVKAYDTKKLLTSHDEGVSSAQWSPNGQRVVLGSNSGILEVWDPNRNVVLNSFGGQTTGINSVTWSPDEQRIAAGSEDTTVKVWDVNSGTTLAATSFHEDSVYSVDWAPGGQEVLSGGADAAVNVWNPILNRNQQILKMESAPVFSVAWSPNGNLLAAGMANPQVLIYDVINAKEQRWIDADPLTIWVVAWSPDGQKLLTGGHDGIARVWNIRNGHLMMTLKGHTGPIKSAAWSPDGTKIATGSQDATIRIWDAIRGGALDILTDHTGSVESVDWSPDSMRLISSGEDGKVFIWIMNRNVLLARLIERVCNSSSSAEISRVVPSWRNCAEELQASEEHLNVFKRLQGQ